MATNNKEDTHLKLSIQVNLNGLSFCILDTKKNEVVFFRKIRFEEQLDPVRVLAKIELEYEQQEALQQGIEEVSLVFSNNLYTLVPRQYFKEEEASNYLKFNTKILRTDFIAHEEVEHTDIVNVYIPYTNIINYFFDKYGEFEYKHSISVLLESLLQRSASTKASLHLYNRDKEYDLVAMEDGKLLLCNSFTYETKEDFLYYLLFTAEQIGLDPMKLDLYLFGEINKESELFKISYNYIKNVHFPEVSSSLKSKKEDTTEVIDESRDYVLFKSL